MMPIESHPQCVATAANPERPASDLQEEPARAPVYDRRLHARLLVAAGHPVAAVAELFGEDPADITGGHCGSGGGAVET
jgi:hypothetical protein